MEWAFPSSIYIAGAHNFFRYCSGGSCSDLVRFFALDLLHCIDNSLFLDEAWSLSGRVYRYHRQRIVERVRLLAHGGEAAPRYQRCIMRPSSDFFSSNINIS